MRFLSLIAIICLFHGVPLSEIQEWPVETVLIAEYGYEDDEYGFEGIEKCEDTSPVGAFYIDSNHIYVSDRFQNNVKIYDISGNFIKAVTLKGTRGKVPGSELLVHESVIYILREGGGIPPEGESNVYIYSFDLTTGEKLTTLKLYNPNISRSKNGNSYIGGATSLNIGPSNGVWIYDAVYDKSYPLVRDGKIVKKEDHAIGIDGKVFESGRINLNEINGNRELYDGSGTFIGIICPEDDLTSIYINVRRHSKDGKCFLGSAGYDLTPSIITWNGRIIGKRKTIEYETWATYASCTSYEFDCEARFYRIYTENRGIVFYRWSADSEN